MRPYWVEVEQDGFAVVANILSREEVWNLSQAISKALEADGVRKRGDLFAIRNLLTVVPQIGRLAVCPTIIGIARKLLGSHAFPVRGTLFDKIPSANWLVPWHQDLTIPVKDRFEITGYGPWTVKAGVVHVQPPIAVLERMIAIAYTLTTATSGMVCCGFFPERIVWAV